MKEWYSVNKKEKGIIAIILIFLVFLSIVLPDSEENKTDEEIDFARSRYHSWSLFVKIVGAILAIAFVGFLVYIHIDLKRIEKIDKERQNKKK